MVHFDNAMSIASQSSSTRLRAARAASGRSRPPCGSKNDPIHYNESLHVAAVFIILMLSTLACAFPIMARRFPSLPIPRRFLFLSRHFGTGVLLATAFVHLLPTAFVSLTDPCLPPFWNEGYPAMPGFISMISVLAVVGVEMFFATRGAGHTHGGDYGMVEQEPSSATTETIGERRRLGHFKDRATRASIGTMDAETPTQIFAAVPDLEDQQDFRIRSSTPDHDDESDSSHDSSKIKSSLSQRKSSSESASDVPGSSSYTTIPAKHNISSTANDPEGAKPTGPEIQTEEQKILLQCMLLEAGILFHSIFIGMALSVAVGTSFVVLLVAISFHQTFEGFALGSRIAGITAFGPQSMKPWLMALAYGITTPIGQAIGLGVHNLYDPESEMGLIMVGIFNSMSSGLLLFAGLVELLAPDFLSDESYQVLQGRKRIEACSAVVAGALLMALVGAWA